MNFIKNIIHKIFPNLVLKIHILLGFNYDAMKFMNSSSSINVRSSELKIQAILIRQYHGIEKVLSLANPRKQLGDIVKIY